MRFGQFGAWARRGPFERRGAREENAGLTVDFTVRPSFTQFRIPPADSENHCQGVQKEENAGLTIEFIVKPSDCISIFRPLTMKTIVRGAQKKNRKMQV